MRFFSFSFFRSPRVIGAVLLAGWSVHVQGQEPGFSETSLISYVEQAQAENPELSAFKDRYDAALSRIPQMRALPDPMLQVSHFVESVQTRTGPQENIFMLSQRLPWFGKLGERESRASADAEALWFAYQSRQLSLARQVAWEYFEYGFTARATELTSASLTLLEELEPIVEQKVATGGDVNALLRLKVEIGKLGDKVASLEKKREAQSARLAALLAVSPDIVLPWPEWTSPAPSQPDGAGLAMALEANNPELQMLQRKISSADAARELARLESFPDITVGVNYIQVGTPTMNPTAAGAGRDPWAVTVGVNLPIWRERTQAIRSEADAGRRAAEGEYENRLNTLRADLSASLAMHADAQRRLVLYGEELIDLANQALENSRAAYEGGRVGILEVIDSERSLLELQLMHWRAAADAWQQRITIQSLANRPITGSL